MKFAKVTNLLLLFLALSIGPCVGQFQLSELSNPEDFNISPDSLQKMNAVMHSLVDGKRVAGIQTAVIAKGKLIHFNSYGFGNMEANEILDEKSIFRIFSMTKPIVSVALMQFYEKGRFALNDPVHLYIPEFENTMVLKDSTLLPAKNPIRIIDLLRHTSGYNYGNTSNSYLNHFYSEANLNSSINNQEFVEKLSKIPLQFEPGTDWQYGLSTNICGYLIEVLSGQSLEQYLMDSVLLPLKMKDTHFQLPKNKVSRFTVGYGWDDDHGLYIAEDANQNRFTEEVTLFNGGGGLVSTTSDYLQFCQMLLNKGKLHGVQILKEETIDLMFADQLKEVRMFQEERLRLPAGEASFGLGFSIRGDSPDSLEKVYGWGGAVGTYFKIDMEHDLAYVMMIQLSPYRQLQLRRIIQDHISASILN